MIGALKLNNGRSETSALESSWNDNAYRPFSPSILPFRSLLSCENIGRVTLVSNN